MSVMLQSLNNIRTLRAMAREFSIDVLEEMLENSGLSLKKDVKKKNSSSVNWLSVRKKLTFWLELMKADGINPEELLGNSSAAAPRAGKNASRVRRNINSPMLTVKLKPDRSGPYTEANCSGAGRR